MRLDLEPMKAYTEGYLGEMKDMLTEKEIESLITGAAIIMLGAGQ